MDYADLFSINSFSFLTTDLFHSFSQALLVLKMKNSLYLSAYEEF